MKRLIAALGAATLCLASANAFAATVTVTNTNDSGPGSLRAAIQGASPGDTINFGVSLPATIDLTGGELVIDRDLIVTGPGADQLTVRRSTSAPFPFRVFSVTVGTVAISGMTITNGSAEEGGGILNAGHLTLRGVYITGNMATGANFRQGGAGIAMSGGELTLNDSTIDSNTCTSTFCLGGGIGAYLNAQTVRINASTISNNSATYGGGVFLGEYGVTGEIRNSTITGNTSTTSGSGIFVLGTTGTNLVGLNNATIANGLPSNIGLYNIGVAPQVEFRNTILSSASNFGSSGVVNVVSHGYNIASDNSPLTDPTDRILTDPLLAPLANYGGPTATHRLDSGSPAIDTGSCADSANGAILLDQRGTSRPQGPACDIGAFEVQAGGLENLDVAVSTRASQTSVTNLQNSVSGLQNSVAVGLDTNVSSRASQWSVDNVQNGVNNVQNAVGSRASQVSVDAITGIVNGKLDAAISTRATQTSVDTVQNNLGSVQSGLGTVQSDLGTMQNGLGTVQTNLGTVQSGLGVVQTNLGMLATQASVNQLSSGLGNLFTGLGTLSTQVSSVGTQVNGLTTALDAPVSTRASQASVDALATQLGGGMPMRPFIELQLLMGARLSSLYLPAAFGGNLETVRDLVASTITANTQAGINVSTAPALLAAGNAAFAAGNYKLAYDSYSRAYQVCALGR